MLKSITKILQTYLPIFCHIASGYAVIVIILITVVIVLI